MSLLYGLLSPFMCNTKQRQPRLTFDHSINISVACHPHGYTVRRDLDPALLP